MKKTPEIIEWIKVTRPSGKEVIEKFSVSAYTAYKWLAEAGVDTGSSRWHKILTSDSETLAGTCSQCGPDTPIRWKSRGTREKGYWVCVKADNTNGSSSKVLPHGLTSSKAREFVTGKVCKICGTDQNLVVDHCHVRGKIRDALCRSHNLALGLFGDDPDLLEAAARYLREHS